jgi:hypothetical protein
MTLTVAAARRPRRREPDLGVVTSTMNRGSVRHWAQVNAQRKIVDHLINQSARFEAVPPFRG